MKSESDIEKKDLGKNITRRMIGGAIMLLIAFIFWNLSDLPPPLPNSNISVVVNEPPTETDFYASDPTSDDDLLSAVDGGIETGTENNDVMDTAANEMTDVDGGIETEAENSDVMDTAADEMIDVDEGENNTDIRSENNQKQTETLTTISISEEVVRQTVSDDKKVFIAAETFRHTTNANNYRKRLQNVGFDAVINEVVVNGEKMQQVGVWAKQADKQALKKQFSTSVVTSRSPFEIQVFVSALRKKANRIADKLRDNQYQTRVDDVVRDGRTLYRVRVIGFQERGDAELAKRKLRPVLQKILQTTFGDYKERRIFIVSEQ